MREILDWILKKGWTFRRGVGNLASSESEKQQKRIMLVSYFICETLYKKDLEDLIKMKSFLDISYGSYDEIRIDAHEEVE